MNRETILGVIVTLLAAVIYLGLAMRVGVLRGKHEIKAPATAGHPQFERAYRVHLNTAEQYIAFLPLFWMATLTFQTCYWLPAVFGVLFLIARFFYAWLYMRAPETRIPGAFLTMFAQAGLLVLGVIGLVQAYAQYW